MNTANIRAALCDRRAALGWTQAYLANRLDTTQSHVSDLESGRVHSRLETLERWADALGYDLEVALKDRGFAPVTR